MTTTIKRKIQPSQMLQLFDSKFINIRWYELQNETEYWNTPNRESEKFQYSITVRHSEEEKAAEVFKAAIKNLNN